jgi:HAD superfamily hydrolase (TIGR01549 family)
LDRHVLARISGSMRLTGHVAGHPLGMTTTAQPAVLLDLDGTLVDSVFHHVIAWDRALADAGMPVPLWRIHAGIGMGGSRLVPWLLGRQVTELDELKDAHRALFLEQADRLRPTDGAIDLIEDLERREVPFIIATSAGGPTREALLEALGRTDLDSVDADSVESSKPAADLILAACAELGVEPEHATLIGDSPWDAEAARRVRVRSIAVRCGGFGDERLSNGGAMDVVDNPRALIGRL